MPTDINKKNPILFVYLWLSVHYQDLIFEIITDPNYNNEVHCNLHITTQDYQV